MKWTFILRDLWLKLWDADIVKLGGMFYVTLPRKTVFLIRRFPLALEVAGSISLQLVITMAHIYEVDVHSQRLVVEALGRRLCQAGRNVLCHSASNVFFKVFWCESGILPWFSVRFQQELSPRPCFSWF